MKKYEFIKVHIPDDKLSDTINEYREKGYEIHGDLIPKRFYMTPEYYDSGTVIYFFRPIE